MPPRHSLLRPLAGGILGFALCFQIALACSVPVFRYALEHWAADPFQVIIFHEGALTADQQAQAGRLTPGEGAPPANVTVRTVDLADAPKAELAALWQRQKNAELPWVVVRFPSSSGVPADAFAGPLQPETVSNVLDSPARREIVERLTDGESAVWLLLESGDKARDDAAAALVGERLDYLKNVLALPKLEEQDIANGLVSVGEDELRLDFSVLRVSRTDAAEQAFVQMLLHSEPDLAEMTQPMLFPIFGRGRALYALVGEGIRKELIEEAAAFLIGKCSCQVKEQNPGVDLLFAADWQKAVAASPLLDRDLPTVAEIAAPVAVTVTASAPAEPVQAATMRPFVFVWLAAGALAAGGAILWVRRRGAR